MSVKFKDEATRKLYCSGHAGDFPGHVAEKAIVALDTLIKFGAEKAARAFPALRAKKSQITKGARWQVHIADGWWLFFRPKQNDLLDVELRKLE